MLKSSIDMAQTYEGRMFKMMVEELQGERFYYLLRVLPNGKELLFGDDGMWHVYKNATEEL